MKSVLITGASSGIGRQLALDYAQRGWKVTACGRNAGRLDLLKQQHENIDTLSFDVTQLDETRNALGSIESLPELLILNAGTCEYIEQGQIDSALFKRVFDANLFGPLHCIEAMQPRFGPQTHLVLVGSSASFLPLPRAEAYGASKAAIAYLANTLAVDIAPTKVTLVSPGFVKTPLTDKNDFPMPMRVSVEEASDAIRTGIASGKSEIHFPTKFTLTMKLIALLPMFLQRRLMGKLTRTSA